MTKLVILIIAITFSISSLTGAYAKRWAKDKPREPAEVENQSRSKSELERQKKLEELSLYYHFLTKAMIKNGLALKLNEPEGAVKISKEGLSILEKLEKEGALEEFETNGEGICYL